MKQDQLNIYEKRKQDLIIPRANNEIQKIRDYDYNFDLPAHSLFYKYDENIVSHSPNKNSLLGINFDLAC